LAKQGPRQHRRLVAGSVVGPDGRGAGLCRSEPNAARPPLRPTAGGLPGPPRRRRSNPPGPGSAPGPVKRVSRSARTRCTGAHRCSPAATYSCCRLGGQIGHDQDAVTECRDHRRVDVVSHCARGINQCHHRACTKQRT